MKINIKMELTVDGHKGGRGGSLTSRVRRHAAVVRRVCQPEQGDGGHEGQSEQGDGGHEGQSEQGDGGHEVR